MIGNRPIHVYSLAILEGCTLDTQTLFFEDPKAPATGWTARKASSSDPGTRWILQTQRKLDISRNQRKNLRKSRLKFYRNPVSLFRPQIHRSVEFQESGRYPGLLAGWRTTSSRWDGWLFGWVPWNCRRGAGGWFREEDWEEEEKKIVLSLTEVWCSRSKG